MQYSAIWSNNGEFIVQVGMEPVNVIKVTQKNELSYMFSRFRGDPWVNYYAIDVQTGEIVGSTDTENVGRNLTEIVWFCFEIYISGYRRLCLYFSSA